MEVKWDENLTQIKRRKTYSRVTRLSWVVTICLIEDFVDRLIGRGQETDQFC